MVKKKVYATTWLIVNEQWGIYMLKRRSEFSTSDLANHPKILYVLFSSVCLISGTYACF